VFDRRHTHVIDDVPGWAGRRASGTDQKPGGFRYWNGIVPPAESYPQRISLWITCGPAVSSSGQPILTTSRKPSPDKLFRRATQAAQRVGDNSPRGGLLSPGGFYPQPKRLDRFGKYRLNGGFCDARQGSARWFASDAASGAIPARVNRLDAQDLNNTAHGGLRGRFLLLNRHQAPGQP